MYMFLSHLGEEELLQPQDPGGEPREEAPAVGLQHYAVSGGAVRAERTSLPCRPFVPEDAAKEIQAAVGHDQALTVKVARTCAICLVDPVFTVSLPCRHSVMCEQCMLAVRGNDGKCPVCRAHIDACMSGHFDCEFVDLAPGLLAAMAKPLVRAQALVYEGMYQNIRVLLLVGAASGLGAATCFLIPVPLLGAGLALAGAAFCVGYLPWLAVTISAFETAGAGGGGQPQLFTREDLGRPLVLVTKAVALLVGAPIALAVFFLPYGLYAAVLRPFSQVVVPFLVHVTLYGLLDLACYSYMYVIRPSWMGLVLAAGALRWLAEQAVLGVRWCCSATWTHVLAPIGQALSFLGQLAHGHLILPTLHGLSSCASLLHRWALAPTWQALLFCGSGLSATASFFYGEVLVPCGHGLSAAAVWTSRYVLSPIGQAVFAAGRGLCDLAAALAQCLASSAGAVYVYVLSPTGWAVRAVVSGLANGLASAGEALYRYVLAPIGTAMSVSASAVYSYGLVPPIQAARACLSALASALVAAGSEVYVQLLLPVGQAVGACGTAARDWLILPAASALLRLGAALARAGMVSALLVQDMCSWLAGLCQQVWHSVSEAVGSTFQFLGSIF